MNKHKITLLGVFLLAFSPALLAATPAGQLTLLTGRGTAVAPDGTVRALSKGDPVYSGELVNTTTNSYANLKFTDGSLVLLRPNSRFQIEEYAYAAAPAAAPAAPTPPLVKGQLPPVAIAPAPRPGTQRAVFRLLKGGFRTVTGLIGKTDQNDYQVRTPVATIGIRGTDYIVTLCDTACAADPVIAASIGAGASAAGGVVVGVIQGGVFVANDLGQVAEVSEDQYMINMPDGTQVALPFEPKFLRVDPIPNPTTCQ